jgi:subtilisin-like proprotein convertase family protein
MRTLGYTLYLDRPMSDPAAKIIGDGKWSDGLRGNNHAWPDFMWQPLAQTPSRRDYENPLVSSELVTSKIHPASLVAPTDDGGDGASNSYTSQDTPIEIPDNDNNGIRSTIEVADGGAISNATVTVDITHTYQSDLRVIVAKDGNSHVLHDRAGGSADDIKKTFDLPQVEGKDAAGTWTLTVVDLARADTGSLKSWTLDLTTGDGDVVDPGDGGDEGGEDTFTNDTEVEVPDNDRTGVTSTIEIANGGKIKAFAVTVDITHTYRGDLLVVLERNGQTYPLHRNSGGSRDDLNETWTVDGVAGSELRGTWTLKIADHARRDVGNLNSWSIEASWE